MVPHVDDLHLDVASAHEEVSEWDPRCKLNRQDFVSRDLRRNNSSQNPASKHIVGDQLGEDHIATVVAHLYDLRAKRNNVYFFRGMIFKVFQLSLLGKFEYLGTSFTNWRQRTKVNS